MNGADVALKRIKMARENEGFPVTTIREIKFLNLMKNQHENIVYLREVVTYNDHDSDEPTVRDKGFNIGDVFMVFEFVDFDLSGLLKSGRITCTEEHVKSFLHQLLKGVQFLHSSNILHRDLKSANLLVTKGNVLKIADWGLARSMTINPSRKLTIPTVTLWYRSPELILGNRQYGPEIDMWSVG
jgi:cyclin-dependent kinase 12/13